MWARSQKLNLAISVFWLWCVLRRGTLKSTLKAKPVVKALTKFFSTFGCICTSDDWAKSKTFHIKSLPSRVPRCAWEVPPNTKIHAPKLLPGVYQRVGWGSPPAVICCPRNSSGIIFSPCDLVFGHTVYSPLRLLKEKWLAESPKSEHNVRDYASSFWERLNQECQLARENLAQNQTKMKHCYDKKSVLCVFHPGENVLVLLPLPGSSLQAQFSAPYMGERKISDTGYVIDMRVCHINMLKRYVSRESDPRVRVRCSSVSPVWRWVVREKWFDASVCVIALIEDNLLLFSDHPRQTSVLFHDIDVEVHKPMVVGAFSCKILRCKFLKKKCTENVIADALSTFP